MLFDGSGEVRPGIGEACDSGVVFCEDMYDCWQTKDSLGGLMTESFNGGGTGITGDDNSLLFELLSLILKHRLSQGVFCEYLDDHWRNEDSRGIFMTELFNGGGTYITGDKNLLLFEWLYLGLKHQF